MDKVMDSGSIDAGSIPVRDAKVKSYILFLVLGVKCSFFYIIKYVIQSKGMIAQNAIMPFLFSKISIKGRGNDENSNGH